MDNVVEIVFWIGFCAFGMFVILMEINYKRSKYIIDKKLELKSIKYRDLEARLKNLESKIDSMNFRKD